MTSDRSKISRVVKFAATEADQTLLQSVEAALAQRRISFSDLCKQALRQLLLESETAPTTLALLATLEQQLMTLQLQVMRLEQQSQASQASYAPTLQQWEQQLQQLEERVTRLESSASPAPEVAAEPEPDPLLARLAPLLEDF
ncbi:MAG: hypothetical protein IGS50_08105 [Synechococcales cyanobacterium C42_A2020_086]|nr:hypothetical protein [Synechococcales cyanobacterium M58_A2018_015]MBF2073710.1 hypothetical protein [Synechococcales cyanobacterium C42_A2020_086]